MHNSNIVQIIGSKREVCYICICERDTRYCSSMRHYATSQKDAGLIPDEVIGFFN
jgi:hypothetical protein